jgi:hypothetical protein
MTGCAAGLDPRDPAPRDDSFTHNSVLVEAIDPEVGGAKIMRQAEAIGWPVVFTVDALD